MRLEAGRGRHRGERRLTFLIVAVGVTCGGLMAYVGAMAAVLRRRGKCPSCGKRAVGLVSAMRTRDRGMETLLRCAACGAEFGQRDDGPLIPRAMWDAGARDSIPPARLLT